MIIYEIAVTAVVFTGFLMFGLFATGRLEIKGHPWAYDEKSEKWLRLFYGGGSLLFLSIFIEKLLEIING